jgi:hypothetical protein
MTARSARRDVVEPGEIFLGLFYDELEGCRAQAILSAAT